MNLSKTEKELLNFFQRSEQLWRSSPNGLPKQEFDEDWISTCQVGEIINGQISWKPFIRDDKVDFKNIEEALEIKLVPSIADFYCFAYSDCLPCTFENHPIVLIQPWNNDDFKRTQENMISHFLMQKRLKLPGSMFIASCVDDSQIISVINSTGQVQLETLGKGTDTILADDLGEFLKMLEPAEV